MIAAVVNRFSRRLDVPEPPTHFAQKLVELRTVAGVSAYRLAQLTGITRQALSQLESGQTVPTWDTVQKLCQALGVSCEEFIDPGLHLPEAPEVKKAGRPKKASDEPPAEPGAKKKPKGKGK